MLAYQSGDFGTVVDVTRNIAYNLSPYQNFSPVITGSTYDKITLAGFGAPDTAANSTFTLQYAVGDVIWQSS